MANDMMSEDSRESKGSYPKSLIAAVILQILDRETDSEHPMNRQEIKDTLSAMGIEVDVKTVGRHLTNLAECPSFGVKAKKEAFRAAPHEEESESSTTYPVHFGYYMAREHAFSDTEIRLLIDGLLFSQHIEQETRSTLINKLTKLASVSFDPHTEYISTPPKNMDDNQQVFRNMELLESALSCRHKVSFHYASYNTDKQMEERKNPDGSMKEYHVSPYQIVTREGKYYLIGAPDRGDRIHIYRLDRILNLEILDEKWVLPAKMLDVKGQPWDLNRYMENHPYMVFGESVNVMFRIPKRNIIDVLDVFGDKVEFSNEDEDTVCVKTRTVEDALTQFARRYAPNVTILKPQYLADRFVEDMTEVLRNHGAAMP